jgi:hypothetical protein
MTEEDILAQEEFWTFSEITQSGASWSYSSADHLNNIRPIVTSARVIGSRARQHARTVHIAQLLLWRFYLAELDCLKYPQRETVVLAFEAAAENQGIAFIRDQITNTFQPGGEFPKPGGEVHKYFRSVTGIDANIRIRHPSDFLRDYVTSQFAPNQVGLAECIISDAFMSPACLLHPPQRIAEGAAIMAAGMTNSPGAVRPKTTKVLAFIRDMRTFYEEALGKQR